MAVSSQADRSPAFAVHSASQFSGRHAHSRSLSKSAVVLDVAKTPQLGSTRSSTREDGKAPQVSRQALAQYSVRLSVAILKWGGLIVFVTWLVLNLDQQTGARVPRFDGYYAVGRHKATCADPLLEPGYLAFNAKDPALTHWTPLNKTCPAPPNYVALLRSFLSTSDPAQPRYGSHEFEEEHGSLPETLARVLKKRKRSAPSPLAQPAFTLPPDPAAEPSVAPPAELEFLRGKTFLVVGDSVDRNAIVHFCALINRPLRVTSWRDPSVIAPDPDPTIVQPEEVADQPLRMSFHGPNFEGYDQRGLPHVCEIPELDFVALNGFHYGMDTADRFNSSFHPDWHAPGRFEDRLEQLFVPYLAARGRTPDVVVFSSGIWDLALFGTEDEAVDPFQVYKPLDWGRMWWWTDRAKLSIGAIRNAWPSAQVVMKKIHRPGQDDGHLKWMRDSRTHQIRNAQESVAQTLGLPIIDFGLMIEGFQQYQEKVHPLMNPAVVLPHAFLHHVRLAELRGSGTGRWIRKMVGRAEHKKK